MPILMYYDIPALLGEIDRQRMEYKNPNKTDQALLGSRPFRWSFHYDHASELLAFQRTHPEYFSSGQTVPFMACPKKLSLERLDMWQAVPTDWTEENRTWFGGLSAYMADIKRRNPRVYFVGRERIGDNLQWCMGLIGYRSD